MGLTLAPVWWLLTHLAGGWFNSFLSQVRLFFLIQKFKKITKYKKKAKLPVTSTPPKLTPGTILMVDLLLFFFYACSIYLF